MFVPGLRCLVAETRLIHRSLQSLRNPCEIRRIAFHRLGARTLRASRHSAPEARAASCKRCNRSSLSRRPGPGAAAAPRSAAQTAAAEWTRNERVLTFASMRILAGDVGGTKTLLQLLDADDKQRAVVLERRYESGLYPTFDAMLRDFL